MISDSGWVVEQSLYICKSRVHVISRTAYIYIYIYIYSIQFMRDI
jgi:hypothetical protein